MINEKENAVLLSSGFTQRQISNHKRKFYNLFRIEPWLVPMRKHGEWVGLTDEEIWEISQNNADDCEYVRAIEAKLKEKNT